MNDTGIALFAYNRPVHTAAVLESLKRNKIKQLFIFCDGPKNTIDAEKVQETRKLIKFIDWTNTKVFEKEKNVGLAQSIIGGINTVLESHDRIIVLEDDCVVQENFITFMEQCFDLYKDTNIMNVSGYSFPIDLPVSYKYDIYFSQRASCWGWGTWRDKWRYFNNDISILSKIKQDRKLNNKIKFYGEDLILMLELQKKGLLNSWAVFWAINIALMDGLCINPVKSLVKNIGHDGSGEHCRPNDKYNTSLSSWDVNNKNFPVIIELNEEISLKCSQIFKLNIIGSIKMFVIKLIFIKPIYLAIRSILKKLSN